VKDKRGKDTPREKNSRDNRRKERNLKQNFVINVERLCGLGRDCTGKKIKGKGGPSQNQWEERKES